MEMKDIYFSNLGTYLLRTLPKHIPEVDTSWFLTHCLPFVSHPVLDKTIYNLGGSIKDGRWKWYPTDPSQMKGTEKVIYRRIEDISNAVLDAARRETRKESMAKVVCSPQFAGKVGYEPGASQMLLSTTSGRRKTAGWYRVDEITNFEFQKEDSVDSINMVRIPFTHIYVSDSMVL